MAKGAVIWTQEEDQQLKRLVGKFGDKKWAIIASHFDRKVSKQCRRRWQNVLNANLKQGSWTAEEDDMLLELHKKLGNKWVEMTRVIKGRTDNAVKNRFIALTRKCMYREKKCTRKGVRVRAPTANSPGLPAPPEASISQAGSPQSLCEGLDESSPSSITLAPNVKTEEPPSKMTNVTSVPNSGGLGGAHSIPPVQYSAGPREDSIHAQQLAWLQAQFLHNCANRFFNPVQIPWSIGQSLTQFTYPGPLQSMAASVGLANGPVNSTSQHFNDDILSCGASSFSNLHVGTSNLLRQFVYINSGMMKSELQEN